MESVLEPVMEGSGHLCWSLMGIYISWLTCAEMQKSKFPWTAANLGPVAWAVGDLSSVSFPSLEERHEAGEPLPGSPGPALSGWLWLCAWCLQRWAAYLCGLCREGIYLPGQEAGLQGPSDHHRCLLGPLWDLGGELLGWWLGWQSFQDQPLGLDS